MGAGDLGIEAVVHAIVGVVVGMLLAGFVVAVTGWDLLWAAGLTVAAVWSPRRLASPHHPFAGAT